MLCAATTQLDDFPSNGVQWGDLGEGTQFRHAGLAAEPVMVIVPNALYAGRDVGSQAEETDSMLEERPLLGSRRETTHITDTWKDA